MNPSTATPTMMLLAAALLLLLITTTTTTTAFTPVHHRYLKTASTTTRLQQSSNNNDNSNTIAVIAGATGYIGKATVRESVRRGYQTFALVRDAKKATTGNQVFDGANVVEVDVTDEKALNQCLQDIASGKYSCSNSDIKTNNINTSTNKPPIDVIVSCLASRSGIKKDAYLIDYQATLNCLRAGQQKTNDTTSLARHFVLLSAFCCKNPWLQFQQAKLKFEEQLQEQSDLTWSIVRPTAFFKSVSGQLEVVQSGAPYVMFGDGAVTRCNPISESELAQYLLDCKDDTARQGRIINLGGPDEPLTMQMQGAMLFNATGLPPKYAYAPLWIFDAIINTFQFFADLTKSEQLENAAETARIGKYYAVEDMLTTDPEEKYGVVSLQEHYTRIATEGQEYDPYTTMFARARMGKFGENNKIEVDNVNKLKNIASNGSSSGGESVVNGGVEAKASSTVKN